MFETLHLQLFADGGSAGGDGGAAAGVGAETGVTASDAGMPRARKGRARENPLANVHYGKQAMSAPGQAAPDNAAAASTEDSGNGKAGKPSFEELVKGEYKADFDQRVQDIIRQRFKTNGENEERLDKMTPIMEMLGKKYNIDPEDIDGIANVLSDDDSLYEQEALERGMSIDSLKSIKKLEAQNEQLMAREQQSIEEMQLRAHFDRLGQQAEEAKQLYPSLDLSAEMNNPMFVRLTAPGVGVDVRTAYEVVHREELRGAEMQYAARKSAERMAAAVRSGSMRPAENGLNSQQSPIPVKSDPKSLLKADREEVKRRVRHGEKIAF